MVTNDFWPFSKKTVEEEKTVAIMLRGGFSSYRRRHTKTRPAPALGFARKFGFSRWKIVFQQELFPYTKERALFMPFLVVYLPRKSSGLSFTTILATNTSNKAAHTGRAKERLPSKAAASSLGVVIIYRHISFSHQWLIIDPFVWNVQKGSMVWLFSVFPFFTTHPVPSLSLLL